MEPSKELLSVLLNRPISVVSMGKGNVYVGNGLSPMLSININVLADTCKKWAKGYQCYLVSGPCHHDPALYFCAVGVVVDDGCYEEKMHTVYADAESSAVFMAADWVLKASSVYK